ncbi:MAG: hypothetical protein R3E56_03920 [Burkholderiaceae bacterium]
MRPTAGDFETREGYRPFIEDYFIHLDAYDAVEGNAGTVDATELYRAAAAHAARTWCSPASRSRPSR